ncbi:MAG: hypothetical protein KKE00_07955, partial [Proteobacteria bacterium]|nr:hypothetical protein [Pseudomonadota bacterium]
MDTAYLIPAPDIIPVHWAWFKVLLITTFTAHILLMNIMLGSAIIAFISGFNRQSDSSLIYLQKEISQKNTFIIAFTINFGVAPLLFLQVLYGNFFYTSSILMAVYWLSVIVLLITAYYAAYIYKFNFERLAQTRNYAVGLSALLLLITGFLYTNNMTLMLVPGSWTRYFTNPSGTILNLSEPTLFPRFFHFVIASIAVSGLFIAITWQRKKKNGVSHSDINITRGMKYFIYATLVQFCVGIWFLISLPRDIMLLFLGGDMVHSAVFLAGLFAGIAALVFGFIKKVWPAAWATIISIIFMVIMRDMVRTAYLKPYFAVENLKTIYQYSP